MGAKRNTRQHSVLILATIAITGVIMSPIEWMVKVLLISGVVMTVSRRYLIPNHWVYSILSTELIIYLILALVLPGLWSVALIIAIAFRFTDMYTPNQVRPRLLTHQNMSPYIGVTLAISKALLLTFGMDKSIVQPEDLSEVLSGMIGLFFSVTILSFLLNNREKVYEKLLKEMAVKEKNWTLELLSLLSHNIRTPVATMSNRIEIIRMKAENQRDITMEDITSLQESNKNVSSIINQLLNNTARTQIRDKEGMISLNAVLKMLQLDKVSVENENKIDFNLSSTNAIALQLCIESLISNAFKYGGIDVQLIIQSNPENYTIAVKDDGQGMSKEQQEHYGTPFNHSQSAGGTGLGVYFTLQLIKEKGWNWKLNSAEGVGTEATLLIPRSKLII